MFDVSLLPDFLKPILHSINHYLAGLIVAVIGAIVLAFWKFFHKRIKRYFNYRTRVNVALRAVSQKPDENGVLREGDGLWIAPPIEHPDYYQTSIQAAKILSIVNLKGGVGKTTITSNLGACLAHHLNKEKRGREQKPILLVDLDFQGTLSGMAKPDINIWPPTGIDSHATRLISNQLKPEHLLDLHYVADDRALLEIVPSYYELAQAENRLMIEWLLKDHEDDIRYSLANILHKPEIRNRYSLIILDCPPRLTTATIQALCASSHLLIPTVMDGASFTAVNSFTRQVEKYRQKNICPYIQHIGVVGSIVNPTGNYVEGLTVLQDMLNESWENGGVDGAVQVLNQDTFIPRYKQIADNYGKGIVYPVKEEGGEQQIKAAQKINKAIEQLASIVKQKMGL